MNINGIICFKFDNTADIPDFLHYVLFKIRIGSWEELLLPKELSCVNYSHLNSTKRMLLLVVLMNGKKL